MKKMFRLSVSTVLVVVLIVAMSACGNNNAGTNTSGDNTNGSNASSGESAGNENTSADTPVELKLVHFGAVGSMTDNVFNFLAEQTAEESGGSLTIDVYGAGSLVAQPEAFDAVTQGRVDITEFQVSYFTQFIPELAALEVPGAYRGGNFEVQRTLLSQIVDDVLQKYGLKLLATFAADTATFVGSKVVRDPANDFKGVTVRVSGKWNGRAVELWGGAPVSMAIADVPTALERKTINMVLSTWSGIDGFKMQEAAPHVTFTEMQELFCGNVINLEKYNSLSVDQRAALDRAAKTFEEEAISTVIEYRENYLKKLDETGVEVYEMSEEEYQYFNKIAWEIIDNEILPDASDSAKELIEAMRNPQLQ